MIIWTEFTKSDVEKEKGKLSGCMCIILFPSTKHKTNIGPFIINV